jgi:hypothetical protein
MTPLVYPRSNGSANNTWCGFPSIERKILFEETRKELESVLRELTKVELQVLERFFAGGNDILLTVLVIPQLRGDPQLFSLDPLLHHFAQRLADQGFILVDRRAVDVPVANRDRAFHRFGNHFPGETIGTKCPQPNSRNLGSGI